jgi:hypothetical protein
MKLLIILLELGQKKKKSKKKNHEISNFYGPRGERRRGLEGSQQLMK